MAKKSKISNMAQNRDLSTLDNSLLSSDKKFQPDWSQNGSVMAKKRMPFKYGIIGTFRDFLAHKLAKISMKPILFV